MSQHGESSTIQHDENTADDSSNASADTGHWFVSASQLLTNRNLDAADSLANVELDDNKCKPVHIAAPQVQRDTTHVNKRKHLNSQQCMDLASTTHGSLSLTRPASVKTSSKYLNRGLYPKEPHFRPTKHESFVNANDVLNPGSAFLRQTDFTEKEQITQNLPYSPRKRQKGKFPAQSNSLRNYFDVESLPSPSLSTATVGEDTTDHAVCLKTDSKVKSEASQHSQHKQFEHGSRPKYSVTNTSHSSGDCPNTKSTIDISCSNKADIHENDTSSTEPSSSSCPVNTSGSDSYGLLGSSIFIDSDDSDFENLCYADYMSSLPLEVIENVLCRLPLTDLCLNVNRVCQRWNRIISNPKFMYWKKRYHRLKREDADECRIMAQLLLENELKTIDTYLPGMIRYMKNFRLTTDSNMLLCLKKHPRYSWAHSLLLERFPECCLNDEPDAWCAVAALVLLAEKVHHVQMVVWCLLDVASRCVASDVLEALYCIAAFLFTFKTMRPDDVWTGMHYRVYYALYLYENMSVSTCGQLSAVFTGCIGQQSLMKYSVSESNLRMTHEQLRICNHSLQPGECVKIIAFAGSGKTTTLMRYAQLRPNWKFLLVVYNKSVCEHAKTRFPRNVACRTGHSLGFQAVGRRYSAASQLCGNVKVAMLVRVLPPRKGLSLYVRAKFVSDTLGRFLTSADGDVTTAHTPHMQQDDDGTQREIEHDMRMSLAEDAALVWEQMKDLSNHKVQMTHDGYLKLYQLQSPKLDQYDVILIDEAQDLTPAISDILLSQRCAKILVGDPHQQIYAFRGAVNAMQEVPASHTFYLTQSFRFGPEIAFVAATCLELLKNETRKTLVGNSLPGGVLGDRVGQLAIISRTNFVLFNEIVKKCCYSNENIRVAFAGGTAAFGFPLILEIYTLMLPPEERKHRRITTPFLQQFSNLGELERYATKVIDVELIGKIKIVKTFHSSLPGHIARILSRTVASIDVADVVFSTAHKAKGLEFSTVKLTDDFCVQETGGGSLPDDEANLLYVAASRAKERLMLTPTLLNLLRNAGERFFYPVASETLRNQSVKFKCMYTDAEWEPYALTLTKKTIQMDGGRTEGGLVSPAVISEEMNSLRHLLGTMEDPQTTA